LGAPVGIRERINLIGSNWKFDEGLERVVGLAGEHYTKVRGTLEISEDVFGSIEVAW
jgi:hypothetical protein